MATNFEPHECIIFVQSTEIGTHENKAIHSILIACHTMWILTHAFFAETFQPMNAALTFQIGLNDCARVIRGKFRFAGASESFQWIRTNFTH